MTLPDFLLYNTEELSHIRLDGKLRNRIASALSFRQETPDCDVIEQPRYDLADAVMQVLQEEAYVQRKIDTGTVVVVDDDAPATPPVRQHPPQPPTRRRDS